MREEENQSLTLLYDEFTKPGRKGSIAEMVRRTGLHRNTIRRILKGKPAKNDNGPLVFQAAWELIGELEQKEKVAQAIFQERIKHRQKINRLRSKAAA